MFFKVLIAALFVANVCAYKVWIPQDCADYKLDPNAKFSAVYEKLTDIRSGLPTKTEIATAYDELESKNMNEVSRMHICVPGTSFVRDLIIVAHESQKYGFDEGANPERLYAFQKSIIRRMHYGDNLNWCYSTPTKNLYNSLMGFGGSKQATPMLVQRAYLDYLDALESWAGLDFTDEYQINDARTLLHYIPALPTNELARIVFPSCNSETSIDSSKLPEFSVALKKSQERYALPSLKPLN